MKSCAWFIMKNAPKETKIEKLHELRHEVFSESIKPKIDEILFRAKEKALKKKKHQKKSGKRNQVTPEKNDEPDTMNWLDEVCV